MEHFIHLFKLLPLNHETVLRLAVINKQLFDLVINDNYWYYRLMRIDRPALVDLAGHGLSVREYYRLQEASFQPRGPDQIWCYRMLVLPERQVYLLPEGVLCEGSNGDGESGGAPDPHPANNLIPGRFIDLAIGDHHTVLLKENGQVYTFGRSGRLGYTINGQGSGRPTPLTDLPPIVQVAAGPNHNVLLAKDGRVFTFGINEFGELGDGSLLDRLTPTEIPFQRPIIAIAVHLKTSYFLTDQGVIFQTGLDEDSGLTTEPVQRTNNVRFLGGLFAYFSS